MNCLGDLRRRKWPVLSRQFPNINQPVCHWRNGDGIVRGVVGVGGIQRRHDLFSGLDFRAGVYGRLKFGLKIVINFFEIVLKFVVRTAILIFEGGCWIKQRHFVLS